MMKENGQKIIWGRDEICKAYNFGRKTFSWLRSKGAPIKMTDGRYFVHRESFDQFILLMTMETEEETKKKAAR
jgi:hypothetical protein